MKIVNKNGPVVLVSREISYTFPLSYAYLAGYLISQGENVKIVFKNRDYAGLVKKIMDLNPILVGFGNLYPELLETSNLVKLLDQAGRKFPIVIGGQMVSPIPEFSLKITGAEFGVIGEGEIILYQLVCALREGQDPSDIKGLVVKKGNEIKNNGPGSFIKDLSKLPQVPYHLFPEEEWLKIGKWYNLNLPQPHWRFNDRVINIHGGRGCPFKCNFCYHHSFSRYRPISNLLEEANNALELYNGNMLYFSDDLVLGTSQRAKELISGLINMKRQINYSLSTRFDILNRMDDHTLLGLKETGCRIMGLGVESGSDKILKTIGKNCTSEEILNNLSRLNKVGILPTVSIMVGQVNETIEDVEASINLMRQSVRQNQNIQYAFTITTPFPGSSLYEYIMKKGLIKDDKEFFDKYFSGDSDWNLIVNLSDMKDDDIYKMYKKIEIIYKKEKEKSLNHKIRLVTFSRINLARFDRKIVRRFLIKKVEIGKLKIIDTIYIYFRDLLMKFLERIDIKLRKLN